VNFAYNTTTHQSTNVAPFEVLYGYKAPLIWDLNGKDDVEQAPVTNKYVMDLKEQISKTKRIVQQNTQTSQQLQQHYYNENSNTSIVFEPDSLVMLLNTATKVGQTRKFADKFLGPYKVLNKIGSVNYKLLNLQTGSTYITHYNRMRPFCDKPSTDSQEYLELVGENSRKELPSNDPVASTVAIYPLRYGNENVNKDPIIGEMDGVRRTRAGRIIQPPKYYQSEIETRKKK
jgi:hypothetical protein